MKSKSGPKKFTDAQRKAQGKRPIIPPEVRVTFHKEGLPLPPAHLEGEALVSWERMSSELDKVGILVHIGRDKLARYCQAWADYSAVIIEKNKCTGSKRWNHPNFYDWEKILARTEKTMCDFEKEYGLTPRSATQIRRPLKPNEKTPEEDLEEFLEN